MKKLLYFELIFLFIGNVYFAKAQNIKIFRGTISYQFNLSRTDKVPKNERDTFQKQLFYFIKNIDLLVNYYTSLNNGDTIAANKILNQDSIFQKCSQFSLAYNYSLARMYQLGVLFKPGIQVNNKYQENNLIFCSEKQFDYLTNNINKRFKLECKYIGGLIIDKVQIYELINIK